LNAVLLEIGVFIWSAMLTIGYALIRSWARAEERRAQLWRVRQQTETLLRQQVGQAFNPNPSVSLNGLRMLADHWRRNADLMEPENEDFVEAIAAFVVMYGSGRVVRDQRWGAGWTVPDHKALAARLAVDIAVRHGRQPNTIAEWIVGLSTEVRDRPAFAKHRLTAAQACSAGGSRRAPSARPGVPFASQQVSPSFPG
jgi:hypothetical protein